MVDALFTIANVGASDYLIDLGSGDGRIVIAVAKKMGARGVGVELDANLLRSAQRDAARDGVSDRVSFVLEDLFFVDLSKATVITLYMSESVNLRLRPALFKLKPGTRVVSHDFDMAQWLPDETLTVPVPNKPYGAPKSDIYLWLVPADASGRWQSTAGGSDLRYDVLWDQTFQRLSGTVRVAGRVVPVQNARVRGEMIHFSAMIERDGHAVRHEFSGRLRADTIEGQVTAAGVHSPWQVTRTARGRMTINE